jgi:hypothetical protein
MEMYTLRKLRALFLCLGVFVFFWSFLGMAYGFYEYFQMVQKYRSRDMMGLIPPEMKSMSMGYLVNFLINAMTQISFLFLMAAVFSRLDISSDKWGQFFLKHSEALLRTVCIGFVLKSISAIFVFWQSLWLITGVCPTTMGCGTLGRIMDFILQGTFFGVALEPLVYAVTIYVLYRHFTRVIDFQKEVI